MIKPIIFQLIVLDQNTVNLKKPLSKLSYPQSMDNLAHF